MTIYKDPNGGTWDIEGVSRGWVNSEQAALIRHLAADLELAIAGWKARGEEIEALQDHVDRCHDWKRYAEAWEDWGAGELVAKPRRAGFGL